MAEVRIGPGLFPAGDGVGLYEGARLVMYEVVDQDCTVTFEGLELGGAFTVARPDGEGPTVNVRAKARESLGGARPRPEQVRAHHQAVALASGNPNPPKWIDPRTGQVSREP